MNTTYIILILLSSPFIVGIIIWLSYAASNTIHDVAYEINKPEKGRYNVEVVNLLSYIFESKTYKFYLQMRLGNSERYLMLGHLTESYDGLSTLQSTYIAIPYNIDMRLRTKFKDLYTDETIRKDKLTIILKYLLGNFQLIKYNDFPKDNKYHYTFICSEPSSGKYDEPFLKKINVSVENFEKICRDALMIKRSYRSDYLKIVKKYDWVHSNIIFPKSWKLHFESREYRSAQEYLIEVLYR